MIETFWYDGQLRKYMTQFMSIFNGLQVQTGSGECAAQMVPVTIVSGSKDRVVAAIAAGNTQNRVFGLPIMACFLQGLALAPERRKAPDKLDTRVTMRTGGIFPEDLITYDRVSPVPYNATFEVAIYASNTMQMHQILEQVLVLFNPELQISVSEGPLDWTRITHAELTDISNEENYPAGTDRRFVIWNLTFNVPIWLSIPTAIRDEVVRRVVIRISELKADTLSGGEAYTDEDGIFYPFGKPFATIDINTREPEGPENIPPKQYNDKPPYE